MRAAGICPMPMMMHHDAQPLYTRKSNHGLLNQIEQLRKAGAVSIQVLMLTPAPGTKLYHETYTSGQVFESVGGRRVDQYMIDGNYVVASHHKYPWRKQFNLLASYLYFYNPLWLISLLLKKRTKVNDRPVSMQIVGMLGATQNIRRTLGWALRLRFGKIERHTVPPSTEIPMRSVGGGQASHDMPVITLTIDRAKANRQIGERREKNLQTAG